jgi:hypothetical protein
MREVGMGEQGTGTAKRVTESRGWGDCSGGVGQLQRGAVRGGGTGMDRRVRPGGFERAGTGRQPSGRGAPV